MCGAGFEAVVRLLCGVAKWGGGAIAIGTPFGDFLGKVGGRVWVALGWRRVQNSRYAGPLALLRLVGLPDVKVAALVSRLLWARTS